MKASITLLFFAALCSAMLDTKAHSKAILQDHVTYSHDAKLNSDLVSAIVNGDVDRVRHALAEGANPNFFSSEYQMPVFMIALYDGYFGDKVLRFSFHKHSHIIASLLLRKGSNVNGRDENGRSALSRMAELGALNEVEYVINHGADVKSVDLFGYTALHWVSNNGTNVDLIGHLVGASKRMRAHEMDDVYKIIRILLNCGLSVDVATKEGVTPLILACHYGNTAVASYLILSGANVNRPNNNGLSPLFCAVASTDGAIVRDLLIHGADPNYGYPGYGSALFSAIYTDQPTIVALLLRHGANPYERYRLKGQIESAIDYAKLLNRTDIVNLLVAHSNR